MTGESSKYQLPAGWEWSRVDAAGEVRMGKQLSPAASAGPDQRPYLRVANVFEDRLDLRDVKRMSFTPAEFEVFRLLSGDVLLNEGQSLELVGRPAVYDGEPADVAFQNTLVRFRPEAGIASRWALTVFRHYLHAGRFSAIAKWTTSMAHLGGNRFAAMSFPVPPTREQQRIVEELDLQLVRIAQAELALRRVRKTVERAKEAVLQAACEGRLVPTESEISGADGRAFEDGKALLNRVLNERRRRWEERELARRTMTGKAPKDAAWKLRYRAPYAPAESSISLPAGWALTSLDAISEIQSGITKGQAQDPSVPLRSVPYLRVANVQRGRLDLREIKTIEATNEEIDVLRLKPGDLLLNEGGDRDKLGRGWVWRGEIAECIHQNHVFRARPVIDELRSELLSWWGNSYGSTFFERTGKQTTNLASINRTTLGSLPVPLPPVAEQVRIVAAVEERLVALDRLDRAADENIIRCTRLRQSLLLMAFEGRLVPQDPNDEPASVLLSRIRAAREAREAERRRNRAAEHAVDTTSAESTPPSASAATRGRSKSRQTELPGVLAAPKAAKPARARTTR